MEVKAEQLPMTYQPQYARGHCIGVFIAARLAVPFQLFLFIIIFFPVTALVFWTSLLYQTGRFSNLGNIVESFTLLCRGYDPDLPGVPFSSMSITTGVRILGLKPSKVLQQSGAAIQTPRERRRHRTKNIPNASRLSKSALWRQAEDKSL